MYRIRLAVYPTTTLDTQFQPVFSFAIKATNSFQNFLAFHIFFDAFLHLQNGWDTDQFPIDNYELTQAMMQIIRNGGLGNGGTNFDAKTRRNSTDLEDIFIAHIAGMDAMARALESAAKLLEESPYPR